VLYRERGSRFGGQVIQLGGGNAVVKAFNYFFGYVDGVDEPPVEAVAELFYTGRDLVEFHGFFLTVSFNNEHIISMGL